MGLFGDRTTDTAQSLQTEISAEVIKATGRLRQRKTTSRKINNWRNTKKQGVSYSFRVESVL